MTATSRSLLTLQEVQEILQCSEDTLAKHHHGGGLPVIDISPTARPMYRVDPADLKRWLDGRKHTTRI